MFNFFMKQVSFSIPEHFVTGFTFYIRFLESIGIHFDVKGGKFFFPSIEKVLDNFMCTSILLSFLFMSLIS